MALLKVETKRQAQHLNVSFSFPLSPHLVRYPNSKSYCSQTNEGEDGRMTLSQDKEQDGGNRRRGEQDMRESRDGPEE